MNRPRSEWRQCKKAMLRLANVAQRGIEARKKLALSDFEQAQLVCDEREIKFACDMILNYIEINKNVALLKRDKLLA